MINRINELRKEYIKKIDELVEWLNYHTELYDKGIPEVSDKEWDDKYFELVKYENKAYENYGYYNPNSPTQKITYKMVDGLEKIEHNHPMLSLDKTKDWNEFLNHFSVGKDVIGMLKLDGLTCSLRYLNGYLVSAETRGDGYVGENILHNAMVVRSIPKRIDFTDELIVDGEIICTYIDFEPFRTRYANSRNFASGSIRLLDSKECEQRNLSFVAWHAVKTNDNEDTVIDRFNLLDSLGFIVVPWTSSFDWDAREFLQDKANKLGYPIDGLVGRYNDVQYGESLGSTGHHSRAAYAFKFYDIEYETTLRGVEWTMGRTGELTPVAVFDALDVDGTTVEKASLHNISVMKEILKGCNLIVPSIVKVFKANEIIPQISEARKMGYDTKVEYLTISPPSICPICGGKTIIEVSDSGVQTLKCSNPGCSGKLINRLDHFCGKDGLDIKGLSYKTLEKLIDWKWVANFEDIFELGAHRTEWIQKEGFGQKSVDNILDAIQKATNTDLDKFVSAIGIPLIGKENAKIIAKKVKTWDDFRKLVFEKFNFEDWDTFGPEKANSLLDFSYLEADIVADRYLIFNSKEEATKGTMEELSFVITGSLQHYSRDELKEIIENSGGKVVGSVSKNTNYLINNNINSTSSKNRRAKELNIPIISEGEFIKKFLI